MCQKWDTENMKRDTKFDGIDEFLARARLRDLYG
jgi:hypothetical protein